MGLTLQHAKTSSQALFLLISCTAAMQAHMGLSGAALSISLSEWAAAVAYLALGLSRKSELGLDKIWVRSGAARNSEIGSNNGSRDGEEVTGVSTQFLSQGLVEDASCSIQNSSSSSSREDSSGGDNSPLFTTDISSSQRSGDSGGVDIVSASLPPSDGVELPQLSTAVRSIAVSYAPFLQVSQQQARIIYAFERIHTLS